MVARLFPFVVCLGCVVGCAETETPSDTSPEDAQTEIEQFNDNQKTSDPADPTFTHKITAPAEYYQGGPQQAQPPDGQFQAETKVTLIEKAGSYSLVRSEDGIEGYVASDALAELEEGANSD